MDPNALDLLLDGLSRPHGSVVLGAGASAPDVPTIANIPQALARFVPLLGGFPAGPIQDSPLRRLISPLIEEAAVTSSFERWKLGAMTSATVAVLLEETIAQSHWHRLPQYDVFRLVPATARIVSFNWDGLARARCIQEVVHPHGALKRRSILPRQLETLLDFTQMDEDDLFARNSIIPGLVMPEEEVSSRLEPVRQQVLDQWLNAPSVVVIGYRFGRGGTVEYDRIWWEIFVEAMRRNQGAPIHIVSPDASDLRGELADALGRSINVHGWQMKWNVLATAILQTAVSREVSSMHDLRRHAMLVAKHYQALDIASEAAA